MTTRLSGHSLDTAGQASRIKFKADGSRKLVIIESEELKKKFTDETSFDVFKSLIIDTSDALDTKSCYHKDCCFAYNIKDDYRDPFLLVECLPREIYQKLALLWGLNKDLFPQQKGFSCKYSNKMREDEDRMVNAYIKDVARDIGIRSELSDGLQVEAKSAQRDEKVKKRRVGNYYSKLMKKLENMGSSETQAQKLGKKAGKITKTIIAKFLNWYNSLGGDEGASFIDERGLGELFQVGFDMPAAKPLAIKIREMPTVPEYLAALKKEPKYATVYALRRFIKDDIKLENKPEKMFAFGSMLPKDKSMRFKPPKNYVYKTWMECSRVPKDLQTMKTVWMGLEKLRSTIAFANWLKNHPDITPPIYLQEKGLMNINYEEWNIMFRGFEVEVTMDAHSDSKLVISQDKSYTTALSMSYSTMHATASSISSI